MEVREGKGDRIRVPDTRVSITSSLNMKKYAVRNSELTEQKALIGNERSKRAPRLFENGLTKVNGD